MQFLLKPAAHLGKQTQVFVAYEAIPTHANVESKSAQVFERNRSCAK
jgi:hypothetical protein